MAGDRQLRGGLIYGFWNRFQALLVKVGKKPVPLEVQRQEKGVATEGGPRPVAAPCKVTQGMPAPDELPPIPNRESLPDSPPDFLHTNACGDFTMLARENWFALRVPRSRNVLPAPRLSVLLHGPLRRLS